MGKQQASIQSSEMIEARNSNITVQKSYVVSWFPSFLSFFFHHPGLGGLPKTQGQHSGIAFSIVRYRNRSCYNKIRERKSEN